MRQAANIMTSKNKELIKVLNSLDVKVQKNVRGRIMYDLRISFPTLFRRLKTGFLDHEIPVVKEILSEFTQTA